MTYTIEVKDDLYEVDTLMRKIIIESRIKDYDIEDVVMQKTFLNDSSQSKKNSDRENSNSESDKNSLIFKN
jgi:hypothetical protein